MAKAAWLRQRWQYRLELPKLCYHPGWQLMRAGYRTCYHTLYDEKKNWKSDLSYRIKQDFFKAVTVSIPLYGCTIWTLTKRTEQKLVGNYTRILRGILKK